MTSFNDRERSFEAQFARDAELQFRVAARRDRLFGLWAAGLLGLGGEAADEYARAMVKADFEEPGDEDVIRKAIKDLGDRASEHDIRQTLAAKGTEARHQIMEAM